MAHNHYSSGRFKARRSSVLARHSANRRLKPTATNITLLRSERPTRIFYESELKNFRYARLIAGQAKDRFVELNILHKLSSGCSILLAMTTEVYIRTIS